MTQGQELAEWARGKYPNTSATLGSIAVTPSLSKKIERDASDWSSSLGW
jgi:hypothetical protein